MEVAAFILKPVKITYLINSLSSGGAEMMLYRLLENLNRKTYIPEVITLIFLEGPIKKKIESLNITVTEIGMRSKLDICSIIRLGRYLYLNKPDILHTQLFAADIIGRVTGKIIGIKVIITSIRNIYYGGKFRDLLIKWTDKFALKTTFVCQDAADRYIREGLVSETKAIVVYNGLDPETFSLHLDDHERRQLREKIGVQADIFLLLAVGSLSRQKGYKLLFEAIAILNKQNCEFYLLIAGEGDLREELQKHAAKLGVKSKINFIGRSDNVASLMAAADLLVLSSLWEGLPGVVLEAMASSLPVVATAVGGTPELVIDGITGYLVQPENPNDLAVKLRKVMGMNSVERKKMGEAGNKRVKEEFRVDRMNLAYENLYQSCLETIKL
jgi:glycosyltransferase involved in cell wall biosynthesis